MTTLSRALQRALVAAAATAAALLGSAAPASAHVTVASDDHTPGEWATLTFKVPNESENSSLTTQLSVTMPQGITASAEAVPGWTAHVDKDVAAGTVRSVTWTASPGTGIAPDQFALFRISLKLPDSDAANFAAAQRYSDGSVVRWDEPPLPDGGEPDHPVPTLTLSAAAPATQNDSVALWVAVAALVVGASAVALALVRRRS